MLGGKLEKFGDFSCGEEVHGNLQSILEVGTVRSEMLHEYTPFDKKSEVISISPLILHQKEIQISPKTQKNYCGDKAFIDLFFLAAPFLCS